jgi:uncharacterized membrane protein YbaN (DUF454 family)
MFFSILAGINIVRIGFLIAGWLAVGAGIIGTIMPLIPGVPFLVLAAWCFSRGSPRVHNWLLNHRWIGPALVNWRDHHVIPRHVKLGAVLGLGASVFVVAFILPQHPAFAGEPWLSPVLAAGWPLPAVVGMINALIGTYVLSRPSRPPVND